MSEVRPQRRAAVVQALAERDLGALVVTNPPSVRYLTGYIGSNGIAVVGPDGTRLLTDFRYANSAAQQLDAGTELVVREQDLLAGIPEATAAVGAGGRVAVESAHITLQQAERLAELLGDGQPVGTTGIVEDQRAVKDADEVRHIRRAAEITDRALQRVVGEGLVGRTEREVAWALHAAMVELGAESPSFDVIVAAGPNGAKPHAVPGDRPIQAGTLVVVDMGAVHDGYSSDMTRTFATGPLPEALQHILDVCMHAQLQSLAAVRAGAECAAVDAVARDIIAGAGYGANFGHGLGHGVGLSIHEAPRLARTATGTLRSGMVVTVEPGIYLDGIGGVRIEDLVVVTDDGCEVLSHFPKDPLAAAE